MSEPSKRALLLKEMDALDRKRLDAESRIFEISREERRIINAGQPRNPNNSNRFRADRDREVGRPQPNKRPKIQTPSERKRPLSSRNHNNDKMADEEKEEGETTEDVKPNLSSVVVNDDEGEATGIEKKPDKKPVKDAIFTRNKRMFGSLLGHLAEAQKRLKTDEKQQKAKEEAEAKAAKKMEEYNVQVREQNLKVYRENKQKELEQVQRIVKDHEEKEILFLELVMTEHLTKTSEYIRTKTSPPLLWIPFSHNEKTTKLLEDAKQEELKRIAAGNLVMRMDPVVVNGSSEKPNGMAVDDYTVTKDEDGDEQLKATGSKEDKSKEEFTVDEGT